jgi:DNA mismatch repair protein MutS
MPFESILLDAGRDAAAPVERDATYFADLHLDLIIRSAIAGRDADDLAPFFYSPLHDPADVRYRHEVFRDLENPGLSQCVRSFTDRMRRARTLLTGRTRLHERYFEQGWFLDAAEIYCAAVKSLFEGLDRLAPGSRGLDALREYLAAYVHSEAFRSLDAETIQLRRELAHVRYCANVRGLRVTVTRYADQRDYSTVVEDTFGKFRRGEVKDYRKSFPERDTNHVLAQVLECVARLHPEEFAALDRYCRGHADFIDPAVERFDREIHFYLAYLDYIEPCRQAGLPFCYPEISEGSQEIHLQDGFDLALAGLLIPTGESVVLNGFCLTPPERILVVTGPNQGGKTTFARMFGQVHYLASLGLPVPGSGAQLQLADRIFSHFEKEEGLATLRGKLEDELVRVHDILDHATGQSLLVMNESFTSTTLEDALFIGTEVLETVIDRGSLSVYVTFVDELARLSETTVSMVATVVPEDPAARTYRVVRKPADGKAYAMSLAEKYGLTYEQLKEGVLR